MSSLKGNAVGFGICQISSGEELHGEKKKEHKVCSTKVCGTKLKGSHTPGDLFQFFFLPHFFSFFLDDSATRNSWILGRTLRIVSVETAARGVLI